MGDLWTVFLIVLTLIEIVPTSTQPNVDDPPLTKSLGFSIRGSLGRTLEDARLNQEYIGLYHEMLRASQESSGKIDGREEQRLEEVVGREKLQIMKRGVVERRRKASGTGSDLGRRRARSQATRREKLYGQSLRSHQHHIRRSGHDHRSELD